MKEFDRLLSIVRRLRADDGCPWDREQTKESLLPYLIEEVYEFIDTVDRGQTEESRKELGDLFLHLVFQAVLAEEEGSFTAGDALDSISEKLVQRHPHVFGDAPIHEPEEMNRRWEQQKFREGRRKVLDGIPDKLPALHKSYRIQEKAAAVGFDWQSADGVDAKIREELGELEEARQNGDREAMVDEMGDLLFSIVNLCRWLHINPDEALRKANNKFSERFGKVEHHIHSQNRNFEDYSLDELEDIWQQIKKH